MRYASVIIWGLLAFAGCKSRSAVDPSPGINTISQGYRQASSVYLTTDTAGNPLISWGETDTAGRKYMYVSFFDRDKRLFGNPIPVPIDQRVSLHEEGMPKMAMKGDGSWVMIYEMSTPTVENKFAGTVQYIQSDDQGKSWSAPVYIHADTSAGKSRSFASVARLSTGELGACWLDAGINGRGEGRPVKFAVTTGKGGFGKEVLIDSMACECCRTVISTDSKGRIAVAYRDLDMASVRDIAISISDDDGNTFSKPVPFSNDQWKLSGCPHNGPSIVSQQGLTYAAWFTGGPQKGIFYAVLDADGNTTVRRQVSANGRYIQLSMLSSGERLLAFNETVQEKGGVYSRIVVEKIAGPGATRLDITGLQKDASFPVVQGFGVYDFVVAWLEEGRVRYTVIDATNVKDPVLQPGNIARAENRVEVPAANEHRHH